jgi:YegS/Rv2252/BmrU family lipid kinase
MTPRVRVILNPYADHQHAGQSAGALKPLIDQNSQAAWVNTDHPAHAVELARQTGEQGFDLLLVLGGDGTVHEVINGLMQLPEEKRPAIGVVPLGSGNDFAQSLGISLNPPEAVRRALAGQPKRMDVGWLQDEHGRAEYFNNTCGAGFDAIVNLRSRNIHFVHGFMMYLVAVLQTMALNFTAIPMSVQTDRESWSQPSLMLALGNGKREGGGFVITPDARVDDGLLHYATIGSISRLFMLRIIPEVMRGTHGRFKQVRLGACREMTLTAASPLCVHTDGEVFAGFDSDARTLTIRVVPNAIRLVY